MCTGYEDLIVGGAGYYGFYLPNCYIRLSDGAAFRATRARGLPQSVRDALG